MQGLHCEVCGGDREGAALEDGRRREVSLDVDEGEMAGLERAYIALREQDPSVFVGEVIAAEGGARLAATPHGPGWIAMIAGALVFTSFDADAGEIAIEAPVVRVPRAQRVPVMRVALELCARELATSRFCLRDDLLLLRFTAGVTALTPVMVRRLLRELGSLAARSIELLGVAFDARPAVPENKRDAAGFEVLGRVKQLHFVSGARRVGPPSSRRTLESVGPRSTRNETTRPAAPRTRPPPPQPRLGTPLRREEMESNAPPPPSHRGPSESIPAILEPMFASSSTASMQAVAPPLPPSQAAATSSSPAVPRPPPLPGAAAQGQAPPRPAPPSLSSTAGPRPPPLPAAATSTPIAGVPRPPPLPTPSGTVRPPPPPPPSSRPSAAARPITQPLAPPALDPGAAPRPSEEAKRRPSLPGEPPPPQRRASLLNLEAVPSTVKMRPQTMTELDFETPSRRPSGLMQAVQLPADEPLTPADHLCALLRQAKLLASMTLESRPATMSWIVRAMAFRAIYAYRETLPDAVAHLYRCTGMGKDSPEPALLVIDRIIAARAQMPAEKPIVVEAFTSAALAKEQIARYLAEIERAPAEPTFKHFLALGALTELLVRAKLPAATEQRLREIIGHGQREGTKGSAIELMMTSLQRIAAG